jgi:hypothetical protein
LKFPLPNQNNTEIPPHPSQNGYLQDKNTTHAGQDGGGGWNWWEYKLGQPLWKSVWKFVKKLKKDLPYDPIMALLGIHLKEWMLMHNRDTYTPMLIAALFSIVKPWNQPKCSKNNDWIKKTWYIWNIIQ